MAADPKDELFWQAFRYAAGELAGAEAEGFERRLEHDQEAREAVAEAVGLFAALAATRPAGRRAGWARPVSWRRAAAMAACLLVAGSLLLWGGRRRPAAAEGSSEVALAWSGLRQAADDELNEPPVPTGELVAWRDDEAPEAEAALASDTALPTWMLEAATIQAPDRPATKEARP